jgi:hypothetical protein
MDLEAVFAGVGVGFVAVVVSGLAGVVLAKFIKAGNACPPVVPTGTVRTFHCLDCGAEVLGTRLTCEDARVCWERQVVLHGTGRPPWI